MLFMSFSCLVSLARNTNILLNKSGENGHPCPFPSLKGKQFSLSSESMMLAAGSLVDALYQVKKLPSIPIFSKNFYH